MPLINGRTPVEFKTAPDVKPEQEVFKIPFTNEIFTDNKEYLERLEYYNQKIFSCKITGKSNLTYEEALASEAEAAKKLIPEYYIEPIAKITHHSTKNLEDLVWEISDYLKDHYFVGEEVVMPMNARKRRIGTVLKIITKGKEKQLEVNWTAVQGDRSDSRKKKKDAGSATNNEEKSTNEEKDDTKKGDKEDIEDKEKEEGNEGGEEKEKKEKKETRHDVPPEVTTVPQSSISRRWFVLSKPVLRHTVKQITDDKHNYTGAPWIVSNEWIEKFGLSKELPKELQELEDKFKNKQNRKRKREEGDVSTEEGPRKKIKLELDDMDIERDEKSRDLMPPQPSTDFEEPQNCLTTLFMTWSFLTSFSNALCLSPYTVEDYSAALNHHSNCALTAHTMFRVLKLALDTVDSDDTKIKKKNLNVKTWQEILPQYLKEKKYEFGHPNLTKKLISKSFFKLDMSERLTIIQFLCDEAMNSNAIREAIIGDLETRKEINKEKSKKLSEIKKQREETSEKTKEKDTKKSAAADAKAKKEDEKAKKEKAEKKEQLKEQKKEVEAIKQKAEEAAEKVRLRANPLGLDRYNNRYWWFGKNYNASITSPISARVLVQYSPHNWDEDAEEELHPYDSEEHSYSSDEEEVRSEHESNSEDSGESSGREARNEKRKAREKLKRQASSPLKSLKNNGNNNNNSNDNGAHAESQGFSMADVDPKITLMKKGATTAWGYYSTKEEVDELLKFLDTRGAREKQLHATLTKKYPKITAAMNKRAIEVKYQINENSFRRSTRVTTSSSNTSAKSDGSGPSFLSYANKLVR